ncbi:MAG: hypothetical protein ACYTGX_11950 [Planctomycetota bacterium]|jgi:hypothetical protein
MGMADSTPELCDAIDELLRRGGLAAATIRPAGEADGAAPGIASDDWSVTRRVTYDQAQVNRWKTDCL